ncbi:hypothetical protein CLV42_1309 [Chitinophaga ginsengisoli]|uniref:Uncharacterized protein n=1 Tax=Chitinophaga ginsengisoli TaxID=363837 RepID=A0A2P8FBI2_9BACT|nr:hypothetical protein CLV42_1309 [Chitinophaga ginsengisoli]
MLVDCAKAFYHQYVASVLLVSRKSGLTPSSGRTKNCARLRASVPYATGFYAQPVTVFAPLRPTFGQLPVWRLAHVGSATAIPTLPLVSPPPA